MGPSSSPPASPKLTCLMAVTVMTKNSGRPLVTGLVGVSIISCKEERVVESPSETLPRGSGWTGWPWTPPASTLTHGSSLGCYPTLSHQRRYMIRGKPSLYTTELRRFSLLRAVSAVMTPADSSTRAVSIHSLLLQPHFDYIICIN